MSISPNTVERGCASGFPQPVSPEDVREARNLVYRVVHINCASPDGPRLPEIAFRDSTEDRDVFRRVFRFDLRDYSDVFRNGFRARPQGNTPDQVYYNLLDHVNNAGAPLDPGVVTPRAFVSTTLSPSLNTRLTNPIGTVVYRYEIFAPGGISVAETLGNRYGFPGQREIAFVGGIAPQYIRAVQLFTITTYSSQGYPRLERSDPTVPSIMISLAFNPQSHPHRDIIIRDPACYYMDRDNRRQPLRLNFYRGPSVEYAGQVEPIVPRDNEDGWYAHDVFDVVSYIDAAFRSSRTDEAYLFMRDEYVVVNYAPDSTDDKRIVDGPLLICDGFPSLTNTTFGEYGIDCAFASHYGDQAYIFSSNMCALMDYAPGTSNNNDRIISSPMKIASMFPFLKHTVFEDGIDAAFEATATDEAYIFRGSMYALINYHGSSAGIIGWIKPIAEYFIGLSGTVFEHGIDAAFASHRRGEAYLFKGEYYTLISIIPGSIDDYIIGGAVIMEILPNWPSLRLPRQNRGLDVHDHRHHTHGNGGTDHGDDES
ncbi:uncharacterized protein LOC116201708 [Punica granatum]|uniref:Pierisin-like domain-containing protein n=2 Tax=Punica granatum TaxID=22663 RepID=A0A218WUP6_PUNGR|nr:uncharacterized protein LOC116201708 [Punica granatum]OWM76577.1 hypothetical protein CDL15_Pgr005541 [Punica granatum]PKI43957.1 hypothetical protein CRG98_035633 [Punica granatum]